MHAEDVVGAGPGNVHFSLLPLTVSVCRQTGEFAHPFIPNPLNGPYTMPTILKGNPRRVAGLEPFTRTHSRRVADSVDSWSSIDGRSSLYYSCSAPSPPSRVFPLLRKSEYPIESGSLLPHPESRVSD
jgi:hypothetical protein